MTSTPDPALDARDLDALIAARRSCRGYLDQQVPRADVDDLLESVQHTPSWCNVQPWQVIVTSGEETSRLSAALLESSEGFGSDFDMPPGYEGVYAARRRSSGWQLYDALGVEKGDREASAREMMRNFEFFGAPHAAFITTEASLGVYGAIDCGLYIQSFLLAAQARGIATCPQAALAGRSPFLREWFDLPDSRKVVCAIAFGYEDPEHPSVIRTDRAPLDEVVTYR